MEKNLDQHVTIQFCVKLGYNMMKTYKNIQKAFGESAVSRATTFRWHGLFTSGNEFGKDEERRGRLKTIKMFKNMARVEQVLNKDCCVRCWMIVESTGILKSIVHHILQDDLKKRKLCTHFIPHPLITGY